MFEIKLLEDERGRFFVISYSSELLGTAIKVGLDDFIEQIKSLNKNVSLEIMNLDKNVSIHLIDKDGVLFIFKFDSFSIETSAPIDKINNWFYQLKAIREKILYNRDFSKKQILNVYSF